VVVLMLGKWGIGRIHFLIIIPVLVGILILSVATMPSAVALESIDSQHLLAYNGNDGTIKVLFLKGYDDDEGFHKTWEGKWATGWTHFAQFYKCTDEGGNVRKLIKDLIFSPTSLGTGR